MSNSTSVSVGKSKNDLESKFSIYILGFFGVYRDERFIFDLFDRQSIKMIEQEVMGLTHRLHESVIATANSYRLRLGYCRLQPSQQVTGIPLHPHRILCSPVTPTRLQLLSTLPQVVVCRLMIAMRNLLQYCRCPVDDRSIFTFDRFFSMANGDIYIKKIW